MVQLYPFSRKAFRFELGPIFEGVRNRALSPSRVVCSLRDILVEKEGPGLYEKRAVSVLNSHFDALLRGFCGIMIHHQRMNDAAFAFLEVLLQQLSRHQSLHIVQFKDLVGVP